MPHSYGLAVRRTGTAMIDGWSGCRDPRPADPWTVGLAAAAVNAVIALVYYARVAKTMWMDPLPAGADAGAAPARSLGGALALALGITAVFVAAAGVLPFQLAGVFAEAAKVVTAGI